MRVCACVCAYERQRGRVQFNTVDGLVLCCVVISYRSLHILYGGSTFRGEGQSGVSACVRSERVSASENMDE